ncbi:hypothetical protein [Nocardioides sp. TF02-7]|uniref:hypothetical protein n=1 Tax=Nocardioides sp. TF02-7 TaxID=2917724 RepID=UPI001F05B6B3|nr:hypothetical protein [Nocardioides sp. TF02-7]UMG92789.1 hypothetical protein MF408_24375 [Nocardioides sp. TF02-7]
MRPSTLSRADRAASGLHGDLWRRFTAFTLSERWRTLTRMQQAVVTNLTDLVTLGDAEDLVNLGCLIRTHGHEEVAAAQNMLDALLGLGPDQPTLTAAIRRIGDEADNRRLLLQAGRGTDDAELVAVACYQHVFWILLSGIEEAGPPPRAPVGGRHGPDRRQGQRAAVARGALPGRRQPVEPLRGAARPAGPRRPPAARRARARRVPPHLPGAAGAAGADDDRPGDPAADRDQRLQPAHLAGYVGTSPSRLSTYATGKVTPSAAMLLRIQRAARGLYERAHPPQLQVVDGGQATSSRPA